MEWGFTSALSMECRLRLAGVDQPLYDAGSFDGVVDLLAIMSTSGALHSLHVAGFSGCKGEAILEHGGPPSHGLRASRRQSFVFLSVGMMVVPSSGRSWLSSKEEPWFDQPP
jgi:hypothetical protein